MNQKINLQTLEDIFVIDSEAIYETKIVQQCFDIVSVFVAAVDLVGNITLINRKGRELLGCKADEIVGEDFIKSFIVTEEQEKTKALFSSLIEGKSSYPESTKYHLITGDNKTKIVEAKNITIGDTDGNILGILISGEDVTEYLKDKNELQKDLNLYRILANNIPDINLYLFDKDIRFILAEGNEMKNNGFSHETFEGKKLSEISSEQIKQIWKPLFTSAIEGEEVSTEYKFNNYNYLIWVLPIKNKTNEIYSAIAITQNITDDKRTEQKLKKAKVEAEEANRAKSDFLARVSHEIRTPLNAILGFAEQLKETNLTKKQDEYVKIIDKSSEHLLSLINDILILSKIEARQINFDDTPFKIEYAVKYVYNALLANAEEKNIRFIYDVDESLNKVLLGDSFRLRQILINLLSNAIKFTHNGYVEFRCYLIDDSEDEVKVRFDVIDTGIGISPENLNSIFQQFKQADSSITKKYGGTGLGLTICKNLIELQNGSLSVISQENIGTTFTFSIPYKKGKETDVIPEDLGAIDVTKLKNKRVLLVDDDSVNRLLGKTILEKFNCAYDIANNGKEAVTKLNESTYDIILLDIHMPDFSGVDVAKYLRCEKKDSLTKIVAVTAAVMKDDIKKYYQAGINDFLIKPFKEIHLFNKMCEVLKIKNLSYYKPKEEIILKEEISPKLYNLEELRQMTGNKEAMIKMLNTFVENSENTLENFRRLLKHENWKQIGEAAHKILPSYRHLEVHGITSDLTEIKTKTLIESDNKTVPVLVEKVIKEMGEIVLELKEEIKQLI
jgi:PAS domain S-box-containing protein